MKKPEIYQRNDRGFHGYGEPFYDSYGASVEVYESSSAEGPHVWLYIKGGSLRNNDGTSHLNEEQARALIARLNLWIEEIPSRWGKETGAN